MTQVLHVSGHVRDDDDPFTATNGTRVALFEDMSVKEVARRVLRHIESHGYQVTTRTTRSLGDLDIREVAAVVTGKSNIGDPEVNMWHLFTTPSDQWPLAEPMETDR
jgi:hypothetical protein